MASSSYFYILTTILLILHHHQVAYFEVIKAHQSFPPSQLLVEGLSYTYYDSTCPELESIVRDQLKDLFDADIGLAAGLLRIQFHDCFVKGCDASILLVGSTNKPSEQQAAPNLTLKPKAMFIIEELRKQVHRRCGAIVSCADIVTLAARDSVYLSGGPDYPVPLGRRDSLTFASINETLSNIPPPTFNTSSLISSFASKNLDAVDLVALSGSHTIGLAHCNSFTNRLYPTQDPIMDKFYANKLKQLCPTTNSTNVTVMDIRSPNKFDNKYYIDLMNRQGLFTSDEDLYSDHRTRDIVKKFALDQEWFFGKYVDAIIKMGQLNVLTGTEGEIRANCSVGNSNNYFLSSNVERDEVKLF